MKTLLSVFLITLFCATDSAFGGAVAVDMDTYILKAETNSGSHFIAPHGLREGRRGCKIWGVNVAVQHTNDAWFTVSVSNEMRNTIFWNHERVEGAIGAREATFANQPVRIIIFARGC